MDAGHGEELFHVTHEKVFLVAIVRVESCATDAGAIEHLLHGDLVKILFMHERDKGIAQSVTRAQDAAVSLVASSRRFRSG